MSAKGELDRLDQIGRDAAQTARHQNHWMNHAGHRSHTAMGGINKHSMPVVGRLAIPALIFLLVCLGLSWGFGVAKPGAAALVVVVAVELLWYANKRRRLSRLQDQSVDLQTQVHNLKEQEFELRYQQAKANGDLDRFKQPEKT